MDRYRRAGGPTAWIAPVSDAGSPGMEAAVDHCVDMGCAALFFHGGLVDGLHARGDRATLERFRRIPAAAPPLNAISAPNLGARTGTIAAVPVKGRLTRPGASS